MSAAEAERQASARETSAAEGYASGVNTVARTQLLAANQPPARFYRGGARIAALRGDPPCTDHQPEDWVGSTTTVRGRDLEGLSRLPDGTLLREAVERDPRAWLGESHVARFGADARLLVKLLDAGQRLPVHAHPHGDFAREQVHAAHGKAEAWYILEPGEVYLGLTEDVSAEEMLDLVSRQDVEALLGRMHRLPVDAGDAVYVPPGLLHAIGEGVLLLEVQEPEDLSILLEWRDFDLDGARDGHLGLGFPLALEAVTRTTASAEQIAELITRRRSSGSVLPAAADEYFGLERIVVDGEVELDPGFAVLLVAEGPLRLEADVAFEAPAGSTVLVPHAAGPVRVSGQGVLLRARPPRP